MQAVQVLLDNNVAEDRIIFLNLVASPEGINAFVKKYPKIRIICAEVDDALNDDKYIVPGVGDFGCRCVPAPALGHKRLMMILITDK